MIVTVANRKGGVGKTTSSVFLAHALAAATHAPCTLIDADPQASAAQWAQLATKAGHPLSVRVLAQPSPRLVVPPSGSPNVVIDTPPGDADIIDAAVGLADLVLVPTSASALDLSRVQMTVNAAAGRGTPAAVLLTRTRRTRSVGAAEESLRSAGVRVLRTHIPLREALAMAFGRPARELHGYDLAAAELLGSLPDEPYSVEAVRARAGYSPNRLRAEHAVPLPQPQPTRRPPRVSVGELPSPQAARQFGPVGLNDDEIIQRLKTSMARLATQR